MKPFKTSVLTSCAIALSLGSTHGAQVVIDSFDSTPLSVGFAAAAGGLDFAPGPDPVADYTAPVSPTGAGRQFIGFAASPMQGGTSSMEIVSGNLPGDPGVTFSHQTDAANVDYQIAWQGAGWDSGSPYDLATDIGYDFTGVDFTPPNFKEAEYYQIEVELSELGLPTGVSQDLSFTIESGASSALYTGTFDNASDTALLTYSTGDIDSSAITRLRMNTILPDNFAPGSDPFIFEIDQISITATVPEPSHLTLIGLSIVGLCFRRRRSS